jgi:Holliday junction resolvasome RuvABC endonuclease subunit
MGVAVLEGANLTYHTVAVIHKGRTPHETLSRGRAIVSGLITDFHPEILVMEKTFIGTNRRLALLNVFADEITAFGRRAGLKVLSIAPSTVKRAITGNGWVAKEEVARSVVSRYPELKAYLLDDPKWKHRFHCNMFDAVALGLVATQEHMR